MRFFKYHGTGNDFIIIDNRDGRIKENIKTDLAKFLCHRNFGVGGDGLILVEVSDKAQALMRIFNPDGSEAEMCGNGIRCLGRFLWEDGLKKEKIKIETLAGVKELELTIERDKIRFLRVDMGAPRDVALRKKLKVDGKLMEYTFVDTGVPHAVLFVNDVDSVDVNRVGSVIRRNPIFPKGANVNFVEKIKDRVFKIRTFERGVERETLSCGSGITASGAASVFLGLADPGSGIEFQTRGGRVYVNVEKENSGLRLFMKGPAEFVFVGEIIMEDLES